MGDRQAKFIVFYGVNNLGKTTQARILVEKLRSEKRKAMYLKYPVYGVEPSGTLLNDYLRGGNTHKLTAREAQMLYAYNRLQYQPQLMRDLESGCNVVAEDYWGTGVAWGIGAGVAEDYLLELNRHFVKEDLAFLFIGERFKDSVEAGHLHETDGDFTGRVAKEHLRLAQKFNWKLINANDTIEEIASLILSEVKKIL